MAILASKTAYPLRRICSHSCAVRASESLQWLVAGNPLHGDPLALCVVTHLVADVGVRVTHVHPFLPIFTRFCWTFFVLGGCWIIIMGHVVCIHNATNR